VGTNVSEEYIASIFRVQTHMLPLYYIVGYRDGEDVDVGLQSCDAV
jgi:hypothetical protein